MTDLFSGLLLDLTVSLDIKNLNENCYTEGDDKWEHNRTTIIVVLIIISHNDAVYFGLLRRGFR